LQAMGHNRIQLAPPHLAVDQPALGLAVGAAHVARDGRGVALLVAFERQILKPVFHLIGDRLWV
jgi:hypothetical protein